MPLNQGPPFPINNAMLHGAFGLIIFTENRRQIGMRFQDHGLQQHSPPKKATANIGIFTGFPDLPYPYPRNIGYIGLECVTPLKAQGTRIREPVGVKKIRLGTLADGVHVRTPIWFRQAQMTPLFTLSRNSDPVWHTAAHPKNGNVTTKQKLQV